jgi:hypothetical protein
LVASSNINGYVSVGYRLDKVTLFSSVSISKNRHKITKVTAPQFPPGTPIQVTFPLQQLALASKEADDRLVVHQHSINVGVKWQALNNLIVKAQIDHFDIQPFGGGLWGISGPENVEKEHRINVFTVSANMVF